MHLPTNLRRRAGILALATLTGIGFAHGPVTNAQPQFWTVGQGGAPTAQPQFGMAGQGGRPTAQPFDGIIQKPGGRPTAQIVDGHHRWS